MGGYGSGPGGGRPTVEGSLRLELPRLRRAGYLKLGQRVSGTWSWSRGGEPIGSVSVTCIVDPESTSSLVIEFNRNGEPVTQHISLEAVPMRFGGFRWYARCPFSGRRCTTLVMPNGGKRFASVKAWRLPYASQNEDAFGRAHRRIAKANERLARMSKYARTPTRQRQWDRLWEGERVLDYALTLAWARISGLEARLSDAGRIKKGELPDD
jgi:hypothetical protein